MAQAPRKPSFRKTSLWKTLGSVSLSRHEPRPRTVARRSARTFTRNLHGQLYSSVAHAQSIAVADRNLALSASLPFCKPHLSAANSLREDGYSPEQTSSGRVYSSPKASGQGFIPWPPVAIETDQEPVPAFVVALCPAPPVDTQTRLPLPCSSPRWAPAHSYLRATPRLGFSSTRETFIPGTGSTTSGRHSPSQLSDDLRPADHVPRGRYPSGLAPYVPGSRLGIVSAKVALAISGDRTQKHPLTRRCRFFAIRRRLRRTHWQALFFGPFMVELFVVGFCRPIAGCGLPPGPACHQAENSPRQPS
jgi:hypothetical protein